MPVAIVLFYSCPHFSSEIKAGQTSTLPRYPSLRYLNSQKAPDHQTVPLADATTQTMQIKKLQSALAFLPQQKQHLAFPEAKRLRNRLVFFFGERRLEGVAA